MREEKKFCYKYPHPAVAADCVILGFDGREWNVLLIERGAEPFKGRWAFPGGFMNIDETAREAAARELMEETSLSGIELEQLGAFSAVDRDPRERVVSVVFFGLTRCGKHNPSGGDDAACARWLPLNDLPPLAFDHSLILNAVLRRLQEKILSRSGDFAGGEYFTPEELDLLR